MFEYLTSWKWYLCIVGGNALGQTILNYVYPDYGYGSLIFVGLVAGVTAAIVVETTRPKESKLKKDPYAVGKSKKDPYS